jgi:hypothetical protein
MACSVRRIERAVTIRVGDDDQAYTWLEDWADVPAPEQASIGWAHHGLAITRSGDVVSFHPERPDVVIFDRDGRFLRSFPTGLDDGHGITLVVEDQHEYLWLADPGSKMRQAADGSYQASGSPEHGQVKKFNLDGTEVTQLARPPHPAYETGRYAPTSVAVDEVRHGGRGDVWVADGYGQSLVHRYRADGTYVETLSGEEGQAGRFNCPHAVFIDRRGGEPSLLVADRGNGRVQVYGLDGSWLRVIGDDFLNSPSAFASYGPNLVIGELFARLAVVGTDDQLVCYLGENGEVCAVEGWPNGVGDDNHPVRSSHLEPGRFNSPHGLAVDADGNLYVAEWLIGGRMIKLARDSA